MEKQQTGGRLSAGEQGEGGTMWSARIWPPVCGHRSVAAMTWPPGRVTRIWPPGSGRLDVAAKQGRQDMATKMWPLGQGLQDVITRTRPSENGRQEFVTRKWPPVREKNIMKKLGAWNVPSCNSSSSGGEGENIMKKFVPGMFPPVVAAAVVVREKTL